MVTSSGRGEDDGEHEVVMREGRKSNPVSSSDINEHRHSHYSLAPCSEDVAALEVVSRVVQIRLLACVLTSRAPTSRGDRSASMAQVLSQPTQPFLNDEIGSIQHDAHAAAQLVRRFWAVHDQR